ncbi:MAG TPA: hypothetical protein PK698_06385 [Bacilli bacterium]|nr:hypothetical protein [Bacilli bacterium]
MALANYKEQFDNAYQAVFSKVLVAMDIANTRLEKILTYGASAKRVRFYIDNIRVRDITLGSNRTIDALYDTNETISIDKNKGTDFRISKKEMIQAGPLKPMESIGAETAKKLARYVDADVFYEIKNSAITFDTGDLTTMTSSGTPITLSTTNAPQLLAQGRAKLRKNNQDLTSLALVLDGYGASIIEQYLMGKSIDLAGAVFKNGYAGPVGGADLYISENLSAFAVLTMGTNPSNGQTLTINGFTFTFVTSIGSTAGNILIEAGVDATRDNLITAFGQGSTGSGTKYVAFPDTTSDNFQQSRWLDLQITGVDADGDDTITIEGKGSGRLAFGGTATYTVTSNYISSYYGKKKAIDVVIQDKADMDIVDDPYQRAKIVRSDVIYGVKTFYDGSYMFMNVKINA